MTTMTTASTCRECEAPLAPSTRQAYAELYGSHALMRLADELAGVLERDPAVTADAALLRAVEHWLGHDADVLVEAVQHRMTEGNGI